MKSKKEKEKRLKILAMLISVFLVGLAVVGYSLYQKQQKTANAEYISYKEYRELLDKGDINTVSYSAYDDFMYITLHNEKTREMDIKERQKYEAPQDEIKKVIFPAGEDFRKELAEKDVLVYQTRNSGITAGSIGSMLFNIVLIIIMFKIITNMIPKTGNAVSEAIPEDINVSFDDVIGHDEVKKDLKLLVKQMKAGGEDFCEMTRGILFEGSAGTGKTMLAKAMAKEAKWGFISVNSSSLIQLYVGLGAKRVREAFARARESAPCILFFDEIDAIGAKRGSTRGTSENDQTINALLAEMDGFNDRGEILVIAATNRADDLDPALTRAGRFDRKIKIEAPNRWETRKELFDLYLKKSKKKADKNVDTASLAKQTVGFSGADISAVCREASMTAIGKDHSSITQEDLEEAIDKIVFKGNRSGKEEEGDAMKIVAYHEAGHAVMNMLTDTPVARISVMGMTSGVGGAVFQADDNTVFSTKESVEKNVMVYYAGRASEEIKFGKDKITDGAHNDITKATELIRAYVTKFGFDDETGLVDFEVLARANINAEGLITQKVIELSKEFHSKAVEMLRNNYDKVEVLANKLLEVKTLSGEEMQELLKVKEETKI